MIGAFFSRQFIAFLLAGGTAALVNFSSRIVIDIWLSYSTAIILAYGMGMVTAFLLYRFVVFRGSQRKVHHSVGYFCLVNLAALAQTWAISIALAGYLLPAVGVRWFVPEIAHFFGMAAPALTSFLGHKYLSFKNNEQT